MNSSVKMQATLVMLICALFLFVKYIAQLFPSLIGQELMMHYSLSGLQLGVLASSYYYSYSLMQIFSGVMLDRFSIKLTAFSAIFLMAVSLYLFSTTHAFALMCVSRILMGVAASFATVLYMKCAAVWTSEKSFIIISSLLATATMLGAAAGGAPLSYLFNLGGWRHGIAEVSAVCLFLSILCLLFVSGGNAVRETLDSEKKKLSAVLLNKQNWMLMIYSGFVFSPVVIMGGLWGMPFLKLKYSISTHAGSYLLSIMFVGLAVGAPLWSYLSVKFQTRKPIMQFANLLSFLSLCLIIYTPVTYSGAVVLFFVLGFSVGCFMISFNICKELNPFVLLGLAFAFINIGEGIVGSVIEPTIGWMLDVFSQSTSNFSIAAFHESLALLPICFVFAGFLLRKVNTNVSVVSIK